MDLRTDANIIIKKAIHNVLPDEAVKRAFSVRKSAKGKTILVSVGKAAWSMANAAYECMQKKPDAGIVITKYEHSKGPIGKLEIFEAGHPIPDENSYRATRRALEMTTALEEEDEVIFLLSGGGSALFEYPLVEADEVQKITAQLLSCGANIVEINTIRKRLSAVKGGRFGIHCNPAKVFCVILSDIAGDPLDMIASGPAYPDTSTCADAERIIEKYGLELSEDAKVFLKVETPKQLTGIETQVTGNVKQLCDAAQEACKELGYQVIRVTDELDCEAYQAGEILVRLAEKYQNAQVPLAFICGGETVVKVTGTGKGGRNQELALSVAEGIVNMDNVAVFSVGSDGTDGPTDAAGGYVDGSTLKQLKAAGIDVKESLKNHDSYHALKAVDGLIITGPTGTNVNDLTVLLIGKQ